MGALTAPAPHGAAAGEAASTPPRRTSWTRGAGAARPRRQELFQGYRAEPGVPEGDPMAGGALTRLQPPRLGTEGLQPGAGAGPQPLRGPEDAASAEDGQAAGQGEEVAEAAAGQVPRQAEVRLRGCAEGGHASGAPQEDNPGPRRHDEQEVLEGQVDLPGRPEVHAARRPQAVGEHADALGADQGRQRAVPHHRGHHLHQRDPLGHRAGLQVILLSVDRLDHCIDCRLDC